MKGLIFTGNSTMKIKEYPDPVAGPGQVVVKMKAAGICGSDLFFLKPPESPPFIEGHEGSGVIHEIGEGVFDLKIGDRVALYHWHGCGQCRLCKAGFYMQCDKRKAYGWHIDGVYSDYHVTEAKYCMKLPDELDFFDGAIIACAGGTAYSSVRKMALSGRTSFVLFGVGPVGLLILKIARIYGVKPIVVDALEDRLDFAKKFGAAQLVDASKTDVVNAVMGLTKGKGAERIMVAAGSSEAQANAVKCLAANGRVGFVGMRAKSNTIDLDHFIRRHGTAVGSYVFPITYYPELAEFLVDNNLHFSDIVTATFKLEEAEKAFKAFMSGSAGKMMFKWDD